MKSAKFGKILAEQREEILRLEKAVLAAKEASARAGAEKIKQIALQEKAQKECYKVFRDGLSEKKRKEHGKIIAKDYCGTGNKAKVTALGKFQGKCIKAQIRASRVGISMG